MSSDSLRRTALRGGKWGVFESAASQGLTVLATMVLARLLTPADYGIIAVVTPITALFTIVLDVGFGAAIIQRQTRDETRLASTFWASVLVGLFGAAVLAMTAGPLAAMIGDTQVAPYLRATSIMVLLTLLGSVPFAILNRDLRFAAVAGLNVSATAAQITVSVVLAVTTPLGAWAIIVGKIASRLVSSGLAFALSGYRPRGGGSPSELLPDMAFNLGYLAERVVGHLAKNVDYWVLSWIGGRTSLGAYFIAFVLPNVARQRITRVGQRTLFPTFSVLSDQPARLRIAYLSAVRFIAILVLPLLGGAAVVADLAVPLAFGNQWDAAVIPMQILSVGLAIEALGEVGTTALISTGYPGRSASVSGIRIAVFALIVLPLASWTAPVIGTAWAMVAAMVVAAITRQELIRRLLHASFRDVVSALSPPLVTTFLMAITTIAIRQLATDLPRVAELSIAAVFGAGTYVLFGSMLFRAVSREFYQDLRASFSK